MNDERVEGQAMGETQRTGADDSLAGSGDEGQVADVTHAEASLVSEIREQYKLRVDFHRAEKRLTLQIKAICRRLVAGDPKTNKARAQELYKRIKSQAIDPETVAFTTYWSDLWTCREVLKKQRLSHERELEKLAKQLPVWTWVESMRGFGPLGLGLIVGECGDLAMYANPAKLWKRMGLALVNGERQRKHTDPELSLLHGYAPERRAVMFVIGDSLVKCSGSPYRDLYLSRKLYEQERAEAAGMKVVPSAKLPKGKRSNGGEYMTVGHIHNRAQRYMEKRLLRDLWRAWRGRLVADDTR
ncbi:MAG: hypothetical protein ACQGVC_18190 [Myxococcota bacterium]